MNNWNPETYLKYANDRTQPSIDLVNRIRIDYQPEFIVDVGCGPGNSSKILMDRWPDAKLLGIDNSETMLARARKDYPQQEWALVNASDWHVAEKFDIIFSNAVIQWIPNHDRLLINFCSMLSDRGVLAFQFPRFDTMALGEILDRVAKMDRWKGYADCSGYFTYHVPEFYFNLLSKILNSVEIWETHYFHVMESQSAVLDWINSTGMKPYLDCLKNDSEKRDFEKEVLQAIKVSYPLQENGKVLFPFKRLFVIGKK